MTRNLFATASLALLGSMVFTTLFPIEALAKRVTIEWQAIPGATAYELQIGEDKPVQLSNPKWKGELPFGTHLYRIRAYDRLKKAGLWSDQLPLAVMPSTPELTAPSDGEKLEYYHPKARTIVEWKAVPGVQHYQLEVERDGKSYFKDVVARNQVDLGALPTGTYSWKVSSVLKASLRAPANMQNRTWVGEPSDANAFEVERPALERPEILGPKGILPPSVDGEVLSWKDVPGAEKYELRFIRTDRLGSPQAIDAALSKAKTVYTRNPSLKLRVSVGNYAWQVRALASVPDTTGKEQAYAGAESQSTFEINPNAMFKGGAGYLALSSMIAPYSYRIESPSAGSGGSTSSTAMTFRGSGEYWLWPQWGIGGAAELTAFAMHKKNFRRFTAELTGKYQASITRDRYGWFVAPKAGLEARQYVAITPDISADGATLLGISSTTLLTIGASAGVDVRKQLSERWSIGAKASYFLPLTLSGVSGAITGDASYRNFSVGLQAAYWIRKNLGLNAGTYLEKRSLSYKTPSSTDPEQLFMDGSYFFGSVLYRFGGN